jgi:DNA-binding transcriptional MerR regulator
MSSPVSIKKLSEQLGIKVSTLRQWKDAKIITPFIVDERDGKSHLYNPECAEFRKCVRAEIKLYFSNEEIGKIFQEIFGHKDKYLKKALETSINKQDLLDKYVEEILNSKNI